MVFPCRGRGDLGDPILSRHRPAIARTESVSSSSVRACLRFSNSKNVFPERNRSGRSVYDDDGFRLPYDNKIPRNNTEQTFDRGLHRWRTSKTDRPFCLRVLSVWSPGLCLERPSRSATILNGNTVFFPIIFELIYEQINKFILYNWY